MRVTVTLLLLSWAAAGQIFPPQLPIVQSGGFTNITGNLAVNLPLAVSPNYGDLSVGGGVFDGVSAGKFAGSAAGTSIAVNEASGYAGDLINLSVNGVPLFKVATSSLVTAGSITASRSSPSLTLFNSFGTTSSNAGTSQTIVAFSINPTYSEASATSNSNTDLLINRVETNLGTTPGAQLFINAQVSGSTKFSVSDAGVISAAQGVDTAAVCWKTIAGGVRALGSCSTQPGATGLCTCN
jgi:hypothetical protein